jgi:hypothetical protein
MGNTGPIPRLERRLGFNFKTTFCRAKESDVYGTPFPDLKIRMKEIGDEVWLEDDFTCSSESAEKKN